MKKKLLIIFLAIVSGFCLVFGLAACDNNAGNGGGNGESGVNGGNNGANENGGEEVWGNVYNLTAAYAKATELGYTGSLEEFIEMISGKDGSQGDDGLSAYDIWLKNGHTGSESDFLEWLKGDKGDDGDEGGQGLSAFEIYVKYHSEYDGTEEEWIESLKGTASGEAVSVKDAYIDADGNLFIVLTNGEEIDCGKVRDDRPTENLQYSAIKKDGQIEGYKVIGLGNVSDMDIVIPSVYNGKPVLDINFYRASRVNEITSVVIPDSITSIGDNAFYGCTSLENVTIPDSVETIGGWAFFGCTSLENVTIPDSVETIGGWAFFGCTSLKSVTIPGNVETIGSRAFNGCTSLKSVTIPDSVETIGSGAFNSCSSLESITVAKNNPVYSSVGNCLIETESKTLIAGSNNSVIPADGSVTAILNKAFLGCTGLRSIEIPDSVTTIGSFAFAFCSSLTSVIIGDSVTTIESVAFYACDSLSKITIPDSVTEIGDDAFDFCSKLTKIYYSGTEAQWAEISIGNNNTYLTNATKYYYSETQPVDSGNFWHYVDGEIEEW